MRAVVVYLRGVRGCGKDREGTFWDEEWTTRVVRTCVEAQNLWEGWG